MLAALGAFVDIEQRDVIAENLVQQNDELQEVRVGLLPEELLAAAEFSGRRG